MLVKQAVPRAQRDEPVISPLVVKPPSPKGGPPLLGPEPGLEEAGKNVLLLVCALLPKVLPDASTAGHGAEPLAPVLTVERCRAKRARRRARMNKEEIVGCFS